MRRWMMVLALLLGVFSIAGETAAQPASRDDWVLLGQLPVSRHLVRDSFTPPDGAPRVTALRLAAKGGRVVLSHVQVAWDDGSVHTEERARPINLLDGERTRPIDPGALPRRPSHIGLVYLQREPLGDELTLEIWGRRPASGATGPAQRLPDRNLLLGTRSVDLTANRAYIASGSGGGKPKAVALRARGGTLQIERVRIVYARGEPGLIVESTELSAGRATSWWEIDTSREVAGVEVFLRPRPGATGRAEIELLAREEGVAQAPEGTRGVGIDSPGAATRPAAVGFSEEPGAGRTVEEPACSRSRQCTAVQVFFGTNREQKTGVQDITFTEERGKGEKPALGRAIVTVPRSSRKPGQIPRPAWSDLLRGRNPWKEDPLIHFTLFAGATKIYATSEAFIADVLKARPPAGEDKDQAFIFVHGYNVAWDEALYRTAQIAYDMGDAEDRPFGTAFSYSWPSAGEVRGYDYDKDSARLAIPHVEAFIELVLAQGNFSKVHLIAHSMGNSAMLGALERLVAKESVRQRIGQVILAAPDVDAGEFRGVAGKIISALAQTLTLYASASDKAMVASRKVHRDAPRAGDVVNEVPVLLQSLDSIDVSAVSTSIFGLNHNTYADSRELLNDMRRLMLTGERPPHRRDVNLKRVPNPAGEFWRYRK